MTTKSPTQNSYLTAVILNDLKKNFSFHFCKNSKENISDQRGTNSIVGLNLQLAKIVLIGGDHIMCNDSGVEYKKI